MLLVVGTFNVTTVIYHLKTDETVLLWYYLFVQVLSHDVSDSVCVCSFNIFTTSSFNLVLAVKSITRISRWLFPFIGHMGIAMSSGVIRDFAGPYYVSVSILFCLFGLQCW